MHFQRDSQKHIETGQRCKRNLSPFDNKVFSTYKGFTSGSRKARQKISVEVRSNIQIFVSSSQQEIKVLY